MFINRHRELAAIERSFASDRAELFVLYGRRRVGKTELLRAACAGRRAIFFVADLGTEASALSEFTRQVSQFAFDRPDAISPFDSWEAAFAFLVPLARDERLVVVLDEFTYLVESTPSLPSVLQRLWDAELRHTRIQLLLCGSYVGLMEQHVLGYRAPLYGRRTGQWQVQPLDFRDARLFLPAYEPADQVRAFAVLGGVPAYLLQFEDRLPLEVNIAERILTPGTVLFDEPRFLLLQELRDPRRYFTILEAIAAGRTRVNEIAQAVGVTAASLSFYLGTLRDLGLVERAVPATERYPERSKQGLHRLLDPFLRFWFRFVHPNRSLLARGELPRVQAQIMDQMDQFTGPVFEAICREHVWRLAQSGRLGFEPRAVGSWWDRQDEVDVVAVGDDAVLVGECKWTVRPVGTNIHDDLVARAEHIRSLLGVTHVRYALFARAGFTAEMAQQAEAENIILVDLAELTGL
jgi:AAA+ ATPase superfamily predicted ATPase